MVRTFAVLFLFQLFGEACVRFAELPIPGAVIGMILLFLSFLVKPTLYTMVAKDAGTILGNMSLFFVPAGVGIISQKHLFDSNGILLLVAVIASTLLTLGFSALLMRLLSSVPFGNTHKVR